MTKYYKIMRSLPDDSEYDKIRDTPIYYKVVDKRTYCWKEDEKEWQTFCPKNQFMLWRPILIGDEKDYMLEIL